MNSKYEDSGSPGSIAKGTTTRTEHHQSSVEELDHRKRGAFRELLRGDEL